jgi:hypothetical protein
LQSSSLRPRFPMVKVTLYLLSLLMRSIKCT